MKLTFLIFLTLLVLGNPKTTNKAPQNVFLIVKRILKGVQERGKLKHNVEDSEILIFINSIDTLFNNIENSVENFKSQTQDSNINGIKNILYAIQIIPEAIISCQDSSKEMIQLKCTNYIYQQRNPFGETFTVLCNMFSDALDIYKEAKIAIIEWKSERYEEFGKQI